MPTEKEREEIGKWCKSRRIMFEVEKRDYDKKIEIKFIDKANNCILHSKIYHIPPQPITAKEVKVLLSNFEIVELFPMLFEDCKFRDLELPNVRLIRED
jgi:hypothetical protein